MSRFTLRKVSDGILYCVMAGATGLIILILAFIVGYVVINGIGSLSLSFIVNDADNGGILPMIVTTLYLVLMAMVVALPIGIITAIYLVEYAGKSRAVRYIRLAIETLAGVPSIIFGLFGLLVFARFLGIGQNILTGALTLSVMILPIIIRTTEESLRTIPRSYREGSLALGTTKWQTIRTVVLPSAMPGILTACILAIGRVVGEAAPVLLTVGISKNIPTGILSSGRALTIHLYYLTKEAAHPDDWSQAFATAAVLVLFVIITNSVARLIARQLKKKMES